MKNISLLRCRFLNLIFTASLLLLSAGCFEAKTDIQIRKDGTGNIKGELVISERMVVAMESADDSERSSMTMQSKTIIDEASLRRQLGDEVKIVSLQVEDLPDGSRRIRYEIEVEDVISYLNAQTENQMHKVRVVRFDETTGGLEFNNEVNSGSTQVELDQLYGLVKGMFVETRVHLPVKVSSEWAEVGPKGQSVTWTLDLRNREGLERAKQFDEKLEGRKPSVRFSLADWEIDVESLPMASGDPVTGIAQSEGENQGKVRAELAAITSTLQQKMLSEEKFEKLRFSRLDKEELEIHFMLTWDEDSRPVNYSTAVLEEMVTDTGEDLIIDGRGHSYSREVNEHQDAVLASVKTKLPSPEAKSIVRLKGYVPIVAGIEVDTVQIENPGAKVGEGMLEDEALKRVGAYLKEVKDSEIVLVTEGEMLESFHLVKADGRRLRASQTSSSGRNNTYTTTYTFPETVEAEDHLELSIRVSETNAKVPFELKDIPLH